MFFQDIHPFTKWLAISMIIQPKDENEMRIIISYKPRLVGYGVPEATVKSWTPFHLTGTPEEVQNKMNQQWIISRLSEATQVVQQADASKPEKTAKAAPAKAAAKKKKDEEEAPVVPKLTPDELALSTMVKDAEGCYKKAQRNEGFAIFNERIRPLFTRIKDTMNAELKARTIKVANDLKSLPEQMEIPNT